MAKIRLLHVEDNEFDQELIRQRLERDGLDCIRIVVSTREAFIRKLETFEPDIVLSDFSLPAFNGMDVLDIANERVPDVPVIIISGEIGEEVAVELLREGAADYILKDRLQRLKPAVERALEEAEAIRTKARAETARQHREQLEKVINRFSVNFAAGAENDFDEALREALGGIGKFTNSSRAYLYKLESSSHVGRVCEWNDGGSVPRENCEKVPIDKFPWARDQLLEMKPLCLSSLEQLPEEASNEREFLRRTEIESLLIVPIAPLGEILGFLGCESDSEAVEWTDETVMLIRAVGEILGNAVSRVETVRQLRNEREFLEKVLNFTRLLVAVVDADGRFVSVNRGFVEATGYSREECIGVSMFDLLVAEESKAQAREDIQSAMSRGFLDDYETRLRTRSGDQKIVNWRADTVSTDGEVHILASGIDVTEQRASERARLQLEAQLAQTERMESLGRVAANVAHEFNNVLMGIQPFADIVGRLAQGEKRLQMASDQIQRSVKRGQGVTGEILRFARPVTPVRQQVSVSDWISQAVETGRAALGDGMGIELVVGEDHSVLIDPHQLDQVISNLFFNARDAMEGSGTIRVEVREARPGGRYRFGVVPDWEQQIDIEVRDQGPGVSKEIQARLFEPFFTTKSRGTGLGLAISHQIVRAHGGYLMVDSRPGDGAAFHLFLPRSPNDSAENDADDGEHPIAEQW